MSEKEVGSPGWVLPTILVAAIAGLVAVALLRGPTTFDPDTPEGVVQEYLRALDEERWEDALAVVHEDSLGNCDADSIAMFVHSDFSAELGHDSAGGFGGGFVEQEFFPAGEEPFIPAAVDATVDVTIIHNGSGGVLGSSWNEFVQFEVTEDDGFWWIVNDPWPYFAWNCRF